MSRAKDILESLEEFDEGKIKVKNFKRTNYAIRLEKNNKAQISIVGFRAVKDAGNSKDASMVLDEINVEMLGLIRSAVSRNKKRNGSNGVDFTLDTLSDTFVISSDELGTDFDIVPMNVIINQSKVESPELMMERSNSLIEDLKSNITKIGVLNNTYFLHN